MNGLTLRAWRRGLAVPAIAFSLVFAEVVAYGGASSALAQDAQLRSLLDRLDRMQRELITLQRHVYRGELPAAPEPSGIPGPSSQGVDLGQTQAAQFHVRLSQFEGQLRNLTGQVEEVSYKVGQISDRLDRLVADVDLRLQRLEGTLPPVAGATEPQQPGPTSRTESATAESGADRSAGAEGASPGVLGTIPAGDLETFRARQGRRSADPAAQTATAPAADESAPGGTGPQEKYAEAFGLLRQANYVEAEEALTEFLERYPDHQLAGNAKYWLGETYYVRGDYRHAAVVFAEGYQKYPDNSKAADNLLKLGMSLAQLGSNDDACGTFNELLERYPDAAENILQRARGELERMSCG
jgi:tol-pal system protein YbgF